MSERLNTEVLIVGAGISGLLTAIELSKTFTVTILSKSNLKQCSTAWAQGGIAAVVDDKDHINNHVEDTLENGHAICDVNSVQEIVKQGKKSIDLLSEYGVKFNKKGDAYDQTLEGGTTDTSEGTTKYGDTTTTETNDIDKAFDELLA